MGQKFKYEVGGPEVYPFEKFMRGIEPVHAANDSKYTRCQLERHRQQTE